MHLRVLLLIARQFWKDTFKSGTVYPMIVVATILIAFAGYSGWRNYTVQNDIRNHYQKTVRQSWENNPDKHPHRMAHYGSFAFRLKHKLSMFDVGMESFTGNAVFLEAHKQNTVNFSEASFSTGLLRFGEISFAMVLQIIFPLIIFFLGFASVASERENGTLKVVLCQGAGWKEILFGKSLGLFWVTMIFYLPVILIMLLLLSFNKGNNLNDNELLRFLLVVVAYFLYFVVVCLLTISVSAASKTSKDALIKLLALWFFFVVLLPKTGQALGNYFHPSPSKVEFQFAIEKDLIKKGDSHNPDDPYYKAIKDSLLQTYKVDSVAKLPFNYSGFIMSKGEKMSTEVYNAHLSKLLKTYQKQNSYVRAAALVNPFLAIRSLSMALSGTDFAAYVHFQDQAEYYRYQLAQQMNQLQIKLISNKKPAEGEKDHSISNNYWKEFPDFQHLFMDTTTILRNELTAIVSLILWCLVSIFLVVGLSKKAKAI